jgi:hypothetical protein
MYTWKNTSSWRCDSITGEDEDGTGGEAVLEGEQEAHALDIVDGATQLALHSSIVDADQEGALVAVHWRVSWMRPPAAKQVPGEAHSTVHGAVPFDPRHPAAVCALDGVSTPWNGEARSALAALHALCLWLGYWPLPQLYAPYPFYSAQVKRKRQRFAEILSILI